MTTSRLHKSSGFTLIELLIVVAVIGIIAAIAVPGLLRARATSNEAATIGSLRAINTAQTNYSTACGNGGYAVLFATLGIGPGGSTVGFLSPELASMALPVKSGYGFALAAGAGGVDMAPDCNGTVASTTYYLSATPLQLGSTGQRSFATNQAGSIWQVTGDVAPTEPFGAPATSIQ